MELLSGTFPDEIIENYLILVTYFITFLRKAVSVTFKVLEYLQKTKTLKMTFFLDQSFAIGLK